VRRREPRTSNIHASAPLRDDARQRLDHAPPWDAQLRQRQPAELSNVHLNETQSYFNESAPALQATAS
jgi:hypothetical protein